MAAVWPVAAGPVRVETEPDTSAASDYVEVFRGDMPLLFAVGHGGWEPVGDLKNSGPNWSNDVLLQDYFYRVLMVRIYQKTGHLPYLVYQQGRRNYVNTNRPVGDSEAYNPANPEAEAAYLEFHSQVDALIADVEACYGADKGLMINPHSTDLDHSVGGKPWDRIVDIGFYVHLDNLGSTRNTMKALYDRRGEAALIGPDSIPYQLFHAQGWPDPDAVWPAAAAVNSKTLAQTGADVWHVLPAYVTGWGVDDWVDVYYTGYSTIQYHGSNSSGHHANWANGLDAFQMEVDYTNDSGLGLDYQLDVTFTTRFMNDLIDAILYSLEVNYDWTPGGVYNLIVDNGDAGFSTTGAWEASSGQGSWGTPSVWTDEVGASATWQPDLAQAGTYQVFVRWSDYEERSPDARYTVNHAGGSQSFVVDQSGGQSAKWVSLGSFRFDAGTGGSVILTSTGSGSSTSADALLLRLVQPLDVVVYLPAVFR